MTSTHQTLIERVKDPSNEKAWDLFTDTYSAYIDEVLRKTGIFKENVIDLRQDILVKLWKKLPEFDYEPRKTKFRTWLAKVIKNTAYNYASSTKREKERVQLYYLDKDEGKDAFDQLLEEEWQEFLCQRALESLKTSYSVQSIAIFKKSLLGESVSDLAKEFSLKENTIYRIKNRVKERLILEIQKLRRDLE